jgi:FKBP-type peptidyl-prolyl cis-trans isomerase FkpA
MNMNFVKRVYSLQLSIVNCQLSIHPLFFLLLILLMFSACKRNGFNKTSSGLEYKIYTANSGPKAKEGDYLTMYLVYKTANDSVIFDSHKDGAPWHFQLMKPPFRGSYEEGLTLLSAGDSATFLVSADSMFNLIFKKPLPNGIASGSKLKFDIQLINIETAEEAELVKKKMNEERRKMEQQSIDQYLRSHNMALTPSPDGLYFLKQLKSTGISPDRQSTCVIEYTGRFLDGKVFESSDLDGQPKQVTLGENAIIKGWEEALLLMRTGEKATIIVPSSLGFGEEGRRNAKNGTYDIYPYTPLVYDLQLRAVR